MASRQQAFKPEPFRVIHPSGDIREAKCTSKGRGPIEMTRSVRVAFMVLRGYLIEMTLMSGFHILDLAGVFQGAH